MTQILVDRAMRDKMLQSVDGVEFVDETGAVVGLFVAKRPQEYEPGVIPPMSDEERQRLLSAPGRHSTEEVLAYLRSL